MPCHSQIILVIFLSFALFFCAWISVCSWFKKPQDRFLSGGCRFDKLLIISVSLGRRCSAVTSWTTANQDCHGTSARARLYKSPLAAAVQSSSAQTWSDWMWQSACACAAARQTCHSDRAAKGQRPRAGAGECEATVTAPWPCVRARKIQQEILLEIQTNILPDILLEIRSYTAWCICMYFW